MAGRYGNYRRSFRVTVRGAGRVWRRTARVHSRHVPDRRIYWETDADVNYRINELKEVYSSNGRLHQARLRPPVVAHRTLSCAGVSYAPSSSSDIARAQR